MLILSACQQNQSPAPTHPAATQSNPSQAEKTASSAMTMSFADEMAAGRNVARKCAACHNFDSSAKIGPGLAGIFGRKAGSMPGYTYRFTAYISPDKAWRWDTAHLEAWVCDSEEAVREFTDNDAAKTAMPAQHLCDPVVQAELITYLKTL